MQRRQIQSQSDLLDAAFTQQSAQGRAAQEQADMLARNVAAGESQNLATNLANIGMDLSPVSAIVGGEGISNTQAQQQAQANRTLAELLGQIEAGRAKQQSDYSLGLTQLEKLKQLMRIQNTMGQQQAMFDQLGGA
jgi:NADPH:quinone reductase-like Zn-dependent oxidoreductase